MIPRDEFYRRRDQFCATCEYWKGVCLKGHSLSSPQGCPLKKFEPILGADYAPDLPARTAPEIPPPGECCGGTGVADQDIQPMTWAQAIDHLQKSLLEWHKKGMPLTPDKVYTERLDQCQKNQCGQYRWWQCRLCKCLIFTKAKMPHESCPADLWGPV